MVRLEIRASNHLSRRINPNVALHGVLEVAVIGAPDDKFGETPLAVVHAKAALDIPALIDHCNRHLANFKVPRYVEIEADPLPRLATGKLAKPALREKYLPKIASLQRVR
jgi:fatty-acyl-CoA synthase